MKAHELLNFFNTKVDQVQKEKDIKELKEKGQNVRNLQQKDLLHDQKTDKARRMMYGTRANLEVFNAKVHENNLLIGLS